ncbi:GntR family transcriptional regulator [Anaerorudis cellulosivorans]|uniref:GntR family transcriptional regulator n=1 Tax=Anaerorudis cellulosivorans TaxID=3397862 RepID=UPI00221FB408|nr:GntR family transcriptional regulator [Seramator thermalis]MCW1734728.1 GntR family transcriptional regulator [Seramator thermalis]
MSLKFNHSTTKVQQLADYIRQSITVNEYKVGEKLPSINFLSQKYNVSRDTVFKALTMLKDKGMIDSIQGKNYYVLNQSTHIFLLLDEYTPFKEALYNSLIKKLPESFTVDLWFHQYNESLFNTIVNEACGKYNRYIVMNYDNEIFSEVLKKINKDRLLLIDFGKFDKKDYAYICQDFDESFYRALELLKKELSGYKKLAFVFNKYHKHPQSSKIFFSRFCKDNGFDFEILDEIKETTPIQRNYCYLVIKQTDVVKIVKQARSTNMKMGKDFGLIAYNENPFYEVIGDGVCSISVDFDLMGSLAADFALTGEKIQRYLPTNVYRRNSI